MWFVDWSAGSLTGVATLCPPREGGMCHEGEGGVGCVLLQGLGDVVTLSPPLLRAGGVEHLFFVIHNYDNSITTASKKDPFFH